MRYYEIHYPDGHVRTPSGVRHLRDLPEGTRVYAVVTERDGSLSDSWELPVDQGRVLFGNDNETARSLPKS